MPRGDGSGPAGMGPMTGRAAGFCNGANSAGYLNVGGYTRGMHSGFGRGFHSVSRGAGLGRGLNSAYTAPVYSKETEKRSLENEVGYLKNQLKTLEDRLAAMQEDK